MATNGDSPDEHRHEDTTQPELPAADLETLLKQYANLAAKQYEDARKRDERDRKRDAERVLYNSELNTRLAHMETMLSDLHASVEDLKKKDQ